MDPYWRVQDEWRFGGQASPSGWVLTFFFLPPGFGDLQHAAEYGPVIIVNARKYACGALSSFSALVHLSTYPSLAHPTTSSNCVHNYQNLPRTRMHMEGTESPGSSKCCGTCGH